MNQLDFPQLKLEVIVEEESEGFCIVHIPSNRGYFRLGVAEARFLQRLNGELTRGELIDSRKDSFSSEQVAYMLDWFAEQGMLIGSEALILAQDSDIAWWKKILQFFVSPNSFRFTLFNPDRLLNKHINIVHALFSKPAFLAYFLALVSPVLIFMIDPFSAAQRVGEAQLLSGVEDWGTLYLMIYGTVILHELAHAAACKHFGGKVEIIGVMFLYLHPVMYCDVSDSWRFRRTKDKAIVTIAGIFLQSVLSGIAFSVSLINGNNVLMMYAYVNLIIALLNFYPFVKLDGYWLLCQVLNEPNLRRDSIQTVKAYLRRLAGLSLEKDKPILASEKSRTRLYFGVGHMISLPAFLVLGLTVVYRYSSHINHYLAVLLVCLFGTPILLRSFNNFLHFARESKSEKAL